MTEREDLLEKHVVAIRDLSNFANAPNVTLEDVRQKLSEALETAVKERRSLMTAGRNTLATRGV